MKNYAEELAYWYFRFNGFFPIDGHVIHRKDEPNNLELNEHEAVAHSENDLLCIRPPFVMEGVGYPDHPCLDLRNIIPRDSLFTGIICEVKAGKRYKVHNNNLNNQIHRIGLFEDIRQAEIDIRETSTYNHDRKSIIRVLIKSNQRPVQGWNIITIDQVIIFIKGRLMDIRKKGGWDKFDSSLMQFLLKHQ